MILPFAPPLEIAAAPLAEALPRVGAALGAPMRAAPALAEEIAVVRLDGATLAETKARFASAFSAEWRTESDGTLILTPDAARREVERRAWRAARRAAVAERLGALRRESRGHDFFDAPEAERLQREIAARAEREDADPTPLPTPARRLFARVLAGLRPEAFDGPEPVGRTVWTLTPNEFQRPLPPDARDALRDYREAVALWEATASREPDDSEPEARADPATRLLLTAARDLDGVTLTLIPIDSAGIAIESVEGYVSFDRPSPAGSPLPFRVPPAEAPTRDACSRQAGSRDA